MDVGVFALVRDEAGRVLLVRDQTRNRHWTLPGGGLQLGELPAECAAREVKEETMLDVRVGRMLGIFSQRLTQGIVILLEAAALAGEPTPDGVETSACAYLGYEELLAMRDEVKPAQLSMIFQALAATEFPIFGHFVPVPR